MLVSFYKMIFDVSFYYSLAAFVVAFFFGQETNPYTFVLFLLAALLSAFAEKLPVNRRVVCVLAAALPGVAFLWEHTVPGRWEFIFPWIYLAVVFLKEKYGLDYYQFKGLFKGLAWTWLLYLICTSFRPEEGLLGLEQCAPYVILTLVSGVMLMQALRYQKGSGSTKSFEKFQVKQTVFFFAGCLVLTVGRAAQLIIFIVENVLLPLGRKLLYELMQLLIPLFQSMPEIDFKPEQEYLEFFQEQVMRPTTEGIEEDVLQSMEPVVVEQTPIDWMPYIIAAMILVAVIVFLILFFSSTQKQRTTDDADEREDLEEMTEKKKKPKKHSLHPELVIRYYYHEFMKKAEWGENRVDKSDTTAEIAGKFLKRKPAASAEAEEITQIYRKVRYSTLPVSHEDVTRIKTQMKRL